MATITITKTENASSSYKATWVATWTGSNQTVNGTFALAMPTMTAKYTYSGKTVASVEPLLTLSIGSYNGNSVQFEYIRAKKIGESAYESTPTTSGTTYSISGSPTQTNSFNASWIFTSSNPTVKTINVYAHLDDGSLFRSSKSDGSWDNWYMSSGENLGVVGTITLNAPPTFTVSTTTTAPYYQKANAYTVNVSSLSAQYGGTISEVKLTIGSQSVTRTNNGTLTLTPQAAGTFTPTVTVTDSRGQVTTKTLDNITVIANTISISNVSAQRINANGILDDEGTNAIITLDANYTAFSGNYLAQPVITIDGVTTSNVTWYESWDNTNGFSDAVNWTNYAPSSPKTLYGKVTDTFTDSLSYQIGVSASTTYAQSSTITTTLAQAFYLLVGRAGGKGLGIGMKPTSDALHIGMEQYNHNDVVLDGTPSDHMMTIKGSESDKSVMYSASRDDTNVSVKFGVGNGGTNHGVWSTNLNKWIIYSDGTNVYANGTNSSNSKNLSAMVRFVTSSTDALKDTSLWSNTTNKIALRVTTGAGNSNGEDKQYTLYLKDDSIQLYDTTASADIWRIYKPADFVVAESIGTSTGTWYYQRWNSGHYECWGRFTESTGATTSDAGGYRSPGVTPPNFPTAFTAAPMIQATFSGAGANIGWAVAITNTTASSAGKWCVYRLNSNASAKGTINLHCIGRWK